LHLDTLLIALPKVPVIAISDIESFASRGGTINLLKAGDNFRFAINLDASMAVNLKFNSKFHSLATEVISSGS